MKKAPTPVTKFQISNYGQLLYNGYPIKMAYGRSFMATTDDSCYTGYETTDFPWVTLKSPLYLVEEVRYEPAPVYRFSNRLAIEAVPMRTRYTGRGSSGYRSKIVNVTADHFIVDVKTYLSWGDKAQKRAFVKACVKVGVFPSHAFLKGHYGRDCIELSNKYNTTVLVTWNGSPILFEPHDSQFISNLEAYYEKQKSCNSKEKFIEIINLLNSTPGAGE